MKSFNISEKKYKNHQIIEVLIKKQQTSVYILPDIVNRAFSISELFPDNFFLQILYRVLNSIKIFSVIFNNF